MTLLEKIVAAAVLGTCIFWLVITLFILTFHFFLPDPFYSVHSHADVVQQETMWGMENFFLTLFLLFFPIAGIFLSAPLTPKWTGEKRLLLMVGISIILSAGFTIKEVYSHLATWKPLELATRSMQRRTFTLGRTSFIPLKQFTIDFSTEGSDLSFLAQEVIPTLALYGYQIDGNNNSGVSDFHTPLKNLEFASIAFRNNSSSKNLWLTTDNYRGDRSIKDMLRLE